MKVCRGNRGTDPLLPNLTLDGPHSSSSRNRLSSGREGPGKHALGGSVGPTACLNISEVQKNLFRLPGIETRVIHPATYSPCEWRYSARTQKGVGEWWACLAAWSTIGVNQYWVNILGMFCQQEVWGVFEVCKVYRWMKWCWLEALQLHAALWLSCKHQRLRVGAHCLVTWMHNTALCVSARNGKFYVATWHTLEATELLLIETGCTCSSLSANTGNLTFACKLH